MTATTFIPLETQALAFMTDPKVHDSVSKIRSVVQQLISLNVIITTLTYDGIIAALDIAIDDNKGNPIEQLKLTRLNASLELLFHNLQMDIDNDVLTNQLLPYLLKMTT